MFRAIPDPRSSARCSLRTAKLEWVDKIVNSMIIDSQ